MGKILIVEDEAEVRDTMVRFLRQCGHHLLTAGEGREAFAIMEGETPDLIILDFFLPDMAALEFVRLAKEQNPSIPIVIVTSFWNQEHAERAIEEGASDFVPKPIDFEHFLGIVESWLEPQVSG